MTTLLWGGVFSVFAIFLLENLTSAQAREKRRRQHCQPPAETSRATDALLSVTHTQRTSKWPHVTSAVSKITCDQCGSNKVDLSVDCTGYWRPPPSYACAITILLLCNMILARSLKILRQKQCRAVQRLCLSKLDSRVPARGWWEGNQGSRLSMRRWNFFKAQIHHSRYTLDENISILFSLTLWFLLFTITSWSTLFAIVI